MRTARQQSQSLPQFLTGVADNIISAQSALDRQGRNSLLRWQRENVYPSAFMWSQFQLGFSCKLQCQPAHQAGGTANLILSPRISRKVNVKLQFRYVPKP